MRQQGAGAVGEVGGKGEAGAKGDTETIVGTLEGPRAARGRSRRRWLVPFDTKMSLDVQVEGAGDVPEGQFVVVEMERPRRSLRDAASAAGPAARAGGRTAAGAEDEPRGRLIEVLGDVETPGVDALVMLRHYGIPDRFPEAALQEATGLPEDPVEADWRGRLNLRRQVVVTIDGESARDFDDAISVERLPEGLYRLGVHIADVAHYVAQGSALDREAYRRGTSVYYPERVIPMLPEGLSNGLCSLRPGVPRLTLSAFLDVDSEGQVQRRQFAESVIQSARRLTYNEVRRVLEEPAAGDPAEYGPVLGALRDLGELSAVLREARQRLGSLDFDLPEGNVELDTDGTVVGILPYERNVAHRLIEELMVAANEAVAYELAKHETPALHRVHDPPARERLEELAELLRPLGVKLEGDLDELPPAALQAVLRQAAGRPDEALLSALVLRTQQRALYSPECRGHYALAAPFYTHFTSPIRRYPDLLVHRRLKQLIKGERDAESDGRLAARLPEIAEHCSATERRAEQSERDLLQWKKVRFLAGRTGEKFSGRITGVQPFGLFVQLDQFHVDGLVPIRTLADDFYVYQPEAHRLVGERHGRVFQLSDEVQVVLTGADQRHRGLDLAIAGMPEARERSEGGARGGGKRRGGGSGGAARGSAARGGKGRKR